jgi:hypothetical protein
MATACFTAWAKCLQQRRFQSLTLAAEAVQRQMHSIESMFNTKLASVTSERDLLQEQLSSERDKVCALLSCAFTISQTATALRLMSQVLQLERREAALKEQVAQTDKKLSEMQRVYMKGVKSTVDSIRAGRAVLGGSGKFNPNSGQADDAQEP